MIARASWVLAMAVAVEATIEAVAVVPLVAVLTAKALMAGTYFLAGIQMSHASTNEISAPACIFGACQDFLAVVSSRSS